MDNIHYALIKENISSNKIPGSSDYMPPERRHAWYGAYATLDKTQRKERSEGIPHYRK